VGRSSRASSLRAWVTELGYRRPVLVIQADSFNRSRIQTVIVAVITGNVDLADALGNVLPRADATGCPAIRW
jgi:mRNA interferase MazF